jgi:hypothetical protein
MSEIKGNSGINTGFSAPGVKSADFSTLGCNNDYESSVTVINLPGAWTISTAPAPPLKVTAGPDGSGNTNLTFFILTVPPDDFPYSSSVIITDSSETTHQLDINIPWTYES